MKRRWDQKYPFFWIIRFIVLGAVGVAAAGYAIYRAYHRESRRAVHDCCDHAAHPGEIEAPELLLSEEGC